MNKYLKSLLIAVSILTLAFTSACAQLPKSGEIKIGPNVESGLETDYLYYSPSGPSENATQEEVILGFLNAGTGPQNDYEVAKSYLTAKFRLEWDPNQTVLIQDGKPSVTLLANNTATIVVPIAAKINSRGQYQTMPKGSTQTIALELSNVDGEWRIQSAPNLTTVIRPVFDVIFNSYALYFFDKQGKHLVPDVRWFPSRASTSTRLVSALLGGPSEWLASSVKTAIPAGTALSLGTVTVADGVATVDLSSKALKANAIDRQLMQTQIRETLIQLNSVYTVAVTVERSTLESSNSWQIGQVQPQIVNPVGLVNGSLVHLDYASAIPVPGTSSVTKQIAIDEFALNTDEKLIAVSGTSVKNNQIGIFLATLGQLVQEPRLLITGTGYLSPIMDVDGFTWVVPKSAKQAIAVFDRDGKKVPFSAGWLSGIDRKSFSISSEGGRIVVAAGAKGAAQVYVAAVERDAQGNPVRLGTPIRPIRGVAAQSVTWLDNIRIGVLGENFETYAQPLAIMIGGSSQSLSPIRNGAQIVGSGQAATVFILDGDKNMYQFRGSNWALIQTSVYSLHYPGN